MCTETQSYSRIERPALLCSGQTTTTTTSLTLRIPKERHGDSSLTVGEKPGDNALETGPPISCSVLFHSFHSVSKLNTQKDKMQQIPRTHTTSSNMEQPTPSSPVINAFLHGLYNDPQAKPIIKRSHDSSKTDAILNTRVYNSVERFG